MAVLWALCLWFCVALPSVLGLQVTPGSGCAAVCLDNPESDALDSASSSTNASDITCSDSDYTESSKGIKFKNCIDCLQTSRAVSNDESDTRWFIYNVQYSVDVCLFGYPNTTRTISSPCNINYACQPLKTALETGILDPSKDSEFEYCDADGGHFNGTAVDACTQCLQASDDQQYLANFMTALRAGCKQRPQPGALIGLSDSLFTKNLVNITAPPSNDTATGDGDSTATLMTTGAIVGIAVGAALLFLGGTALFWVYHRKQKRLYDSNVVYKYDPREGSASVTPPLKWPSASIDSKPGSVLSQYELRTQATLRTGNDHPDFDEEVPIQRANYHFDPNQSSRGPGSALPVHPAYVPRAMSRTGARELSPEPPFSLTSNPRDNYTSSIHLVASREVEVSSIGPRTMVPASLAPSRLGTRAAVEPTYTGSYNTSRPPPPPGPPQSILSRGIPPRRGSNQPLLPGPPPPPPPPTIRAPKLTLPSVPRLRGAKKYQPPQIIVELATPVSGPGESVPIGIEISHPLTEHGQRFA
ncbi:hypothetical protein PFICI_09626 [Pestalotiopsis fici W106-1]|uniref:LPXTG-domain-containing protein n=1 Tax=Pestalotiopsis fici (strain W106-1 / CGMCC3.15140) TaxID=1229662 RepID=W3X0Y4_PESFW|nr:uncharacterized protein PFICI_09626 [Pestalotiopsis fici W106-1]ETS79773.1 hypothetical protein PFICI_09626 [Pestalotiopsis fici W106-1]